MELFSTLNSRNHNIALINEFGEVVRYSELIIKIQSLSSSFKDRSITIFLTNNSLDSIIIYLSLLYSGSVPLLLESTVSSNYLQSLINLYNPDYIIDLKNNNINYKNFTINELTNDYYLYISNNLNSKIQNKDLALLLATSGSTGSPKYVRITYKNILENTKSICQYLALKNNSRAITTLPMSYSFGLSVIHTHLYIGASILFTNKSLVERELWNLITEFKVSFFSGVPFSYEILKKINFFSKDLPNIEYLVQAGGKLNTKLVEEFAKDSQNKNRKFFVMYGQTEATARMSYLPYKKSLSKLNSIGIPIPNGKFSLVDIDGNIIYENNKCGELIYDGPNVCLGYAESRLDLDLDDQNKGRLYTGDLATRDEDGYYYIVGRKKRFIKISGKRMNLDDIEHILKNDSIDCACVGSDDCLVVYITDDKFDLSNIRINISKKLNIHVSLVTVKFISSIPKNMSGKINYQLLR